MGYIAPVCQAVVVLSATKTTSNPKNFRGQRKNTDSVDFNNSTEDAPTDEYAKLIYCLTRWGNDPIMVDVQIEDKPFQMEVDTGAALSTIPGIIKQKYFPELSLQKSWLLLQTYTGENLKVLEEMRVQIQYGKQLKSLMLRVVEGRGPMLLGRARLKQLQLDWKTISTIAVEHNPLLSVDQLCATIVKYLRRKSALYTPLKGHSRSMERQD